MKKLKKTILRIMPIFFMYATKVNAADVVSEVQGGGSIQNSKLGQGLLNIVRDITGTMQWILPITGVCFILFYVFKIMTGDEQRPTKIQKINYKGPSLYCNRIISSNNSKSYFKIFLNGGKSI